PHPATGQLRDAHEPDHAPPDRGPRGRSAGRPCAQGRDPGWRLVADPQAGGARHPVRPRSAGGGRIDGRLGRRHGDRRHHLHRPARPAHGGLLHARELRQVHALPRGHALDHRHAAAHRGGHRGAGRDRPGARDLRQRRGQVPVPAGRRLRDAGALDDQALPRGVRPARRARLLPAARDFLAQLALPAAAQPAAARDGVALMSATDVATVTLEIDGRELTVPKGTPLVLAAAEAGVEIPIFCYEPRLGPAIGACRMCLVEIEGMPKLQAACTMTAGDGMKVHTRSASAAEGQEAVLEFILLNHPLDCPVCDKGGECPLQDLTYRYGPGNTRFHLNKRTYEKPLAISPLIALDRERCILCYRCTRFSQDVAQDEQLVARERGATSVIATFEEQPYRGRFSGNVIELCPVGALTSTQYRFKARPWEINNIPSVCALCPTGCNTWATVREGGVQRMLSRNHPDVDEGWLCDKGRFAHVHLHAGDRYLQGLVRGPRGLEPATAEQLAETIARRLRHHATLHGPESIAVVASGEQSNEEAHAWAELVRAAGGGALVGNGFPGAGDWDALAPYAATIAELDRAD